MPTSAVVCELNPLHKGHVHVIEKAKALSDVVLLVMSGNFTERAIPAVFDKYARAEAAIKCGADVVVELPYPWSAAGLESFAHGGVTVASAFGADRLVFGSESGDFDLINEVARIKSEKGFSFAAEREEQADRRRGTHEIYDAVMQSYGISGSVGANDKLGAEYVRYGRDAGIFNFTIEKRVDTPSASEIRKTMPEAVRIEQRYNGILFDFCRINGENSENELVRYAARVAHDSVNGEEFIANLPTKKYTLARLRREILAEILHSTAAPTDTPEITVLLGASERGREYLSTVRKDLTIELVTKPADAKSAQAAVLNRADELYCLCADLRGGEMMRKKPYVEAGEKVF